MHLDGHFKDFEILEILKTGTNRDVDAVIGFLYRNYASFLAIYVQENGGKRTGCRRLVSRRAASIHLQRSRKQVQRRRRNQNLSLLH